MYVMEVGNKLNPERSYRQGFALKSIRQHIKTNNPSMIGPDELLTVRFPDLKENQVIVPGTTKLTFNISLSGTDTNKTLVKAFDRNVIRKLVVKLESNEIISIDDCDIFYYYNCWKSTTERHNAVFQGIVEVGGQTENAIKHMINAGDKANDAKDETVASVFEIKFCIPLDFEILETCILYDRILRSRIIPLSNSDTSFSVDINSPSKSLKGVLFIFMKERSTIKFNQDTEEFFNPKITEVEVTVEGSPNEFFMLRTWNTDTNTIKS